MHRDKKLTQLARDQACVNCGANDGTTVWAHANGAEFGKGMGIKAHDCYGMFLCSICHHQLDQGFAMTRDEKREFTYRNICKTHLKLWQEGLVKCA